MKQKILIKGPVLTRSGYGEQSRFALRALRSREDLFDIYIQPLSWGKTSWISEQTEERQAIDEYIKKTVYYLQQGGKFDMSLQVTIPNEFEELGTVNVGYTAGIESTACSAEWLEIVNKLMSSVIDVSSFSKKAFKDTVYSGEMNGQPVTLKLEKPIDYVNYPVKDYESVEALELELDYDINFLSVAQWGPRKNMAATVKWFIEEFHDEEIGLIVKTNMAKNCVMDREHMVERLTNEVTKSYPDKKCKIYLIHGDMTESEMHALYKNPKINAMISFPHGEGFGLPLFEAAYSGMPIVCTGWSGQLDFLVDENGKEFFYNVSFDINQIPEQVVWEGVLIKESMWAYPRESSAKEQMRKCYDNILSGKNMYSAEYAEQLKERFSAEKMYKKFVELVYEQAPSQTVINDVDEIEQLFAEAL